MIARSRRGEGVGGIGDEGVDRGRVGAGVGDRASLQVREGTTSSCFAAMLM